jgi:hypothetical protein
VKAPYLVVGSCQFVEGGGQENIWPCLESSPHQAVKQIPIQEHLVAVGDQPPVHLAG